MEKRFPEVFLSENLRDELYKKYSGILREILRDIKSSLPNTVKAEIGKLNKDPSVYGRKVATIKFWARRLKEETDKILSLIEKHGLFEKIHYAVKWIISAKFVSIYDNNRLKNITRQIEADCKLKGYVYKYFNFFNEDCYMYKINILNKKLEYDIAESGYVTEKSEIIKNVAYESLFAFLEENNEDSYQNEVYSRLDDVEVNKMLRSDNLTWYAFVGWKKKEYIKALKESELFEENVETIETERGINYVYTYPNLGHRKITTWRLRSFPILDGIGKVLLEYLYRYLNEIGSNVTNLTKLCQIDYIDAPTLQRVLVSVDPKFRGGDVKDLGVNEICSLFNIRKELISGIPKISEDIILQPGGKYARDIQRKYIQQRPGLFKEKLEDVKLKPMYEKYMLRCGDPNIPIQDIIFDAMDLRLTKLINRNMSRDELCRVIRNYLENILTNTKI